MSIGVLNGLGIIIMALFGLWAFSRGARRDDDADGNRSDGGGTP
jgi:hypothetical protein